MSVSLYRNQVDRLKKEIANLEKKAAEERAKASRERSEALRLRSSITRSSSPSIVQSKLKQAQQHEGRGVQHDKQAVRHADSAASKGRQLATAQASLERALADQEKKDEAQQRRRREEELRHIQKLESANRAAQRAMLASSTSLLATQDSKRDVFEYEYDICLSFASEERGYVEMVAAGLKKQGLRVFYDLDEQVKLWGKDLAEHFDYIYRRGSRYCVMFISEAYAKKPWTRHERRSALARAIEGEDEYILPARFDDTELAGLRPTILYLDLRQIAPDTLVGFIAEKLGGRPEHSNPDFTPPAPPPPATSPPPL